MISRRQILLATISAMAGVTVPAVTEAMPIFHGIRFPMDSGGEDSPMADDESFNFGTFIKVIGVGGAGCNVVSHLSSTVQNVEFICVDSDAQPLIHSGAHKTVQLGSSGWGADSDKAREAAELAVNSIRAAIDGTHLLFVVAGLGGGAGSGAAPVIARVARELGISSVVGVVTMPLACEGAQMAANADLALTDLQGNTHSVITVHHNSVRGMLGGDVEPEKVFARANAVQIGVVRDIAEIINVAGHCAVDFEDVRTVMEVGGMALMGTAAVAGPDRARIAAEQAMASPLLEGIDLSGAKGVLVLISGSQKSLKLFESKLAMNTVRARSSPDAYVIYGTTYDDSIGDMIRVTVVATGVKLGA